MRILILNPNTSSDITARLATAAKQAAAAGTILSTATAPRGVPYIATRAEAQIGGAIALEMLAERHKDYDAAIIAAFGDPGLFGARELFDIPVVGMAEASMLTACMLGSASPLSHLPARSAPGTRNAWISTALRDDAPAFGCSTIRSSRLATCKTRRKASSPNSRASALELEADVVILAGAPLAGLAARVRDRVSVPVVDQMAAAVKQAEALVTLGVRKATVGTFRRPDAKPTTGLPETLAARVERRD